MHKPTPPDEGETLGAVLQTYVRLLRPSGCTHRARGDNQSRLPLPTPLRYLRGTPISR
jgi:hypothetical protein